MRGRTDTGVMAIETEKLRYVYNPKTPFEKTALDDITLSIEDGDFFGIIGHTGSGKSTLISHFNALTRVQSGKITVFGDDITPKKIDFKKLRSTVGMVFQYPEYQLFAETVEKDVEFGCKNIGLDKDECAVRVKEAIELVGLDYEKFKDRSPFELSGGQRRRVALAGVLAMRPKILVLDEPTAGLDPRGKSEIMDLVRDIRKSCPTTVMISHNMDEIAEYCNKIAVLSDGKLYGVFEPRQLFGKTELLKSLGLDVPQVTKIACALADLGFGVDRSAVTLSELTYEIEKEFNTAEEDE